MLVDILSDFISYPHLSASLYKKTEREAYRLLLQTLLANISISHFIEHQDEDKKYEMLDIPARLNMDANEIVTSYIKLLINNHLLFTPFTIYIQGNYTPFHFDREIQIELFSLANQDFLPKNLKLGNNNF